MKTKKQIWFRMLFAVEVLLYVGIYIFAKDGIISYMQEERALFQEEEKLRYAAQKTIELQMMIDQYKKYPFFREKIAREKLQMSRKGEQIFIYS